jgi:ATP-binding cassette subfamily B protein/subfamily B ATP-binding cassette protein MsbA
MSAKNLTESPPSRIARIARLLRYARPYRAGWTVIILLTLATAGVGLAMPWPVQFVIDHVLGDLPMGSVTSRVFDLVPFGSTGGGKIALAVAGVLFIYLFGAACDWLITVTWVRTGQRMVYDLVGDLLAKVQRQSLRFHHRHGVGDLMARLTGDSWCVYSVVDQILLGPARALLTSIFMIAVMARMDWKLTLIALAAAPFVGLSSYLLGAPIRVAAQRRREIETRLFAHVQQTLTGIPVVQAFAQEDREQNRFRQFANAAVSAQKRTALTSSFHGLAIGLASTFGSALVLWIGIRHVVDGTLTLGAVTVFLAYLAALQIQMRQLFELNALVQNLSANVDRVLDVLDSTEDELPEAPNAIHIKSARGDLRFERVTFGYEPGRSVVREIDLHVPAGQTVALVGSSGAGKSTLASLVPRFVDPWRGCIRLDGHDLRELSIGSLRDNIAIVMQETLLLPMTVAETIAYGRPAATRAEVESAARAAGADEFIRRLRDGYDTILSERGSSLSGGERQRLAIARALLKDATLLILDEPTASLDAGTEAEIMQALRRLIRGRTTLLIAHRLSTVRHADRIVVLDRGEIVEEGTHEGLIVANGIYARMYEMQMGGKRADASPVPAAEVTA